MEKISDFLARTPPVKCVIFLCHYFVSFDLLRLFWQLTRSVRSMKRIGMYFDVSMIFCISCIHVYVSRQFHERVTSVS